LASQCLPLNWTETYVSSETLCQDSDDLEFLQGCLEAFSEDGSEENWSVLWEAMNSAHGIESNPEECPPVPQKPVDYFNLVNPDGTKRRATPMEIFQWAAANGKGSLGATEKNAAFLEAKREAEAEAKKASKTPKVKGERKKNTKVVYSTILILSNGKTVSLPDSDLSSKLAALNALTLLASHGIDASSVVSVIRAPAQTFAQFANGKD
jgi:hypothetical protein